MEQDGAERAKRDEKAGSLQSEGISGFSREANEMQGGLFAFVDYQESHQAHEATSPSFSARWRGNDPLGRED